jgi:hypothetical protein
MKLTPQCHYDPNADEHEIRCARCETIIQYSHVVIDDDGQEIALGVECVKRLRDEMTKESLRGRYDWKLADVRERAYYDWYCASMAHAD